MNNFDKTLLGYTDHISVVAGDYQQFMVSSRTEGTCTTRLVRLICGDPRARGAGFQEESIHSSLTGQHEGQFQPLYPGSYALAKQVPQVPRGGLSCYFFPTLPERPGDQVMFAQGELALLIRDSRLLVRFAGEEQPVAIRLRQSRWHRLEMTFTGREVMIKLLILPLGPAEAEQALEDTMQFSQALQKGLADLTLAAEPLEGHYGNCFNGKLEAVCLQDMGSGERQVIADWRFEEQIAGDELMDVSGNHHHARCFNSPVRATKGHRWDASVHDYRQDPTHYGAVHFHEDDLTDAGWQPSLAWEVPDDLPSGQYALKLQKGDETDYIPFFVRPAAGHQRASILYLASTATYIAYANQRRGLDGMFAFSVRNENDAYLRDHPEVGPSLYEHHVDGSGVHYSSYLRPVLNLRPGGTMWSFNADTNVTAWLEWTGLPFDVITDEDLHREGEELLSHYSVTVTGTHPEYYSGRMLNAMEAFLQVGGRLMYMGGNGFYWKIAYHPTRPAIIEVRRAEDGTRAWIAEPGDYYQAFDSELGGLWRRNGRPPNQLVGIGFAAQGFDGATYYRKTEAAEDPRVTFIWEGTSGDEIIGNYGSVEGGAAGQEIDRWDPALGSPRHALVLASSEKHNPGMLRVVEELSMNEPDQQGPKVRADMTFFETPFGGAVFSTGSVSYAGALAHNNYDNDICRLTTNVLRRFANSLPFNQTE